MPTILGKKYSYTPYKDELYYERMVSKLKANPSFYYVFKRDLTDKFLTMFKKKVNPKFMFPENLIISVSGLTGTGKSIVTMSIGKIVFPKFSYNNVFFYDKEILDNAKHFEKNSLIIRDEGTPKGIFGFGSQRTRQQMQLLAETLRKYGLNLMLVEPEFTKNKITKYYIETIDMDIKQRITRVALIDGQTLKYLGALYIPVLPENDKDWIKYNKAKDKFIDDVRKGKIKGVMDSKTIIKEVMAELNLDVYRTKLQRKAFITQKYPNFTIGEINTIHNLVEAEINKRRYT